MHNAVQQRSNVATSSQASPCGSSDRYQVCTQCVMDTSDPNISFDEQGTCNHHAEYRRAAETYLMDPAVRAQQLDRVLDEIKKAGKNKPYDCVLGVSGGVDSSFLAYRAKQLELRPLVVHFDNGWNSELAVSNIEKMLSKLGFDLETYVVDWNEFRDLQVSFLKASVSNIECPTDHAIFACLYRMAVKHNIGYVLSGSNLQSEGILPSGWEYSYMDWRHIKSIHKIFGSERLRTFPSVSLKRYFYYFHFLGLKKIRLLHYLDYDRNNAIRVLENELGWRYYGGKHYESIYTKFHQTYYLPTKFGIDKRRAHLSSLIVSGQMTRAQAIAELEKPLASEQDLARDIDYVRKKLELSATEFDSIIQNPPHSFADYPNNDYWFKKLRTLKQRLSR